VDLAFGRDSIQVTNCVFAWNSAADAGALLVNAADVPTTISGCIFYGNTASVSAGALYIYNGVSPNILVSNCTFCGNSSPDAAAFVCYNATVELEKSIIAFNGPGEAIKCLNAGEITLSCCDLYGNDAGNFTGCIAGMEDVDGNFSADPLFCDYLNANLFLFSSSPCAPGNHPYGHDCDLIGALGTACDPAGIEEETGAPRALIAAASPNPFSSKVAVTYQLGGVDGGVLRVLDVKGREIWCEELSCSEGVITWDGTNTAGERVKAGVYFVGLEVGGRLESRRVCVLR
jgi:hypothetical protein